MGRHLTQSQVRYLWAIGYFKNSSSGGKGKKAVTVAHPKLTPQEVLTGAQAARKSKELYSPHGDSGSKYRVGFDSTGRIQLAHSVTGEKYSSSELSHKLNGTKISSSEKYSATRIDRIAAGKAIARDSSGARMITDTVDKKNRHQADNVSEARRLNKQDREKKLQADAYDKTVSEKMQRATDMKKQGKGSSDPYLDIRNEDFTRDMKTVTLNSTRPDSFKDLEGALRDARENYAMDRSSGNTLALKNLEDEYHRKNGAYTDMKADLIIAKINSDPTILDYHDSVGISRDKKRKAATGAVHKILEESSGPGRASLDFTQTNVGYGLGQEVSSAKAFMEQVSAPHTWERVGRFTVSGQGMGFRANASDTVVSLASGNNTQVVIHEMGHMLEHHSYHALRVSNAFLDENFDRSKKYTMTQLTGNPNYGSDELAHKPKSTFFPINSYLGKNYEHPNYRIAPTEVVSLGMEQIYHNPVDFASQHYSHFRATLKALHS